MIKDQGFNSPWRNKENDAVECFFVVCFFQVVSKSEVMSLQVFFLVLGIKREVCTRPWFDPLIPAPQNQ
jgi:hypothetical protein